MNKPKYSIIVPTLNRAYSLWRTIDSLVRQRFSDFEVLVIDGGSEDNSQKLVTLFGDKRVNYVLNKNDKGVASARNEGIRIAKGHFVAYLDSDDFVYPDWLEQIDRHVKDFPNKLLFMPNKNYKVVEVDNNYNIINIFVEDILFSEHAFNEENIINLKIECDTNGMVHKKNIVERIGYWNEDLKLYEDYEFLLRISSEFKGKIHYVPQVLVSYTRTYGKDSLCSRAKYKDLINSLKTVKKIHGKGLLKNNKIIDELINKFKKNAQKEESSGVTILQYLKQKYGKS